MKSTISIIAAIGKNRELGKNNALLWNIPGELPRFKRITTGHPIIMGRKTFASIGRPLPNRTNIIITRNKELGIVNNEGVIIVNSLEQAIEEAKKHLHDFSPPSPQSEQSSDVPSPKSGEGLQGEIFIIGGGQIFEQALPMTDKIYLTLVDKEFDADTFFPDYSAFTKVVEREDHESEEFKYSFITLVR
ncbi:MAG: dihydrofolate reductase [bacterium]|nr:dihydrofolate reductase [bacterium]